MNVNNYDKIKQLSIIAIFSDDYLLEKLVLKGGNALNFIYKINSRASMDIDLSMENDFKPEELPIIENKIKNSIINTFKENNFEIFDLNFTERPKIKNPKSPDFWGGYAVEFKVISKETFDKFKNNPDSLRKHALTIDNTHKRKVKIDISKFEYCQTKKETDFEGYTIYVYTPEMIIFEKIRSLCQQMPEYTKEIYKTKTPRSRDFYDIYTISQIYEMDFNKQENKNLIKHIFDVKKVPLNLINKIKDFKEFHEKDFESLKDTVSKNENIKEFNFYFEYLIEICNKISHSLGIK